MINVFAARASGPVASSAGGSHAGDDGWTAVGRAPKSIVDPARMKLTKQPMDENVQLGPGGKGMSAWHRGSSGGLKTLSQESDRPMPTPNRLAFVEYLLLFSGGKEKYIFLTSIWLIRISVE